MAVIGWNPSSFDLSHHGIVNVGNIFWNIPSSHLYEQIIRRREGMIAHLGPVVVRTGHHTGRSPLDRFIVKEPTTEENIWWGKVNRPFEPRAFDLLQNRLLAYLQGRDLFVQDLYAGADTDYHLPVRVITETAWHSLFARNMFVRPDWEKTETFQPEYAVLNVPGFRAVPELDGTNSEAFILLNFAKKLIIIGGTSYAGEIKKSVFSILNYHLPLSHVLSMHCSANVGERDDACIFFGLSGTGKTTLSADKKRRLIGDDEHGWSPKGLFNFEGGCYAKVIRLDPEGEPDIYATTRRFGTILENVAIDLVTRRVDLNDNGLTENTRAAYPVTHIPNAIPGGTGGHPNTIIMLTLDAFGVLPPVAKLTPEQAMYHFISGYTAKVAGTETGLSKEPKATFSACFGAPFMALNPTVYAALLGEKIKKHAAQCYLVNTGWSGGGYGVGKRIALEYSRAIVNAIHIGALDNVSVRKDPIFGFEVPTTVPGVPSEILDPRATWKDPSAYDETANRLKEAFRANFKDFEGEVSGEVLTAGF